MRYSYIYLNHEINFAEINYIICIYKYLLYLTPNIDHFRYQPINLFVSNIILYGFLILAYTYYLGNYLPNMLRFIELYIGNY